MDQFGSWEKNRSGENWTKTGKNNRLKIFSNFPADWFHSSSWFGRSVAVKDKSLKLKNSVRSSNLGNCFAIQWSFIRTIFTAIIHALA